jgi:hypothetical protein
VDGWNGGCAAWLSIYTTGVVYACVHMHMDTWAAPVWAVGMAAVDEIQPDIQMPRWVFVLEHAVQAVDELPNEVTCILSCAEQIDDAKASPPFSTGQNKECRAMLRAPL